VSLANPVDVQVRLGRDFRNANEMLMCQAFLDDVELKIRVRIPTLDALIAAGTVSAAVVQAVEVAAVRRVLLNPEGFSQEAIDNWSGTRAAVVAGGLLTIADLEWRDILPGIEGRRRGAIRAVAYGEAYYGQPYVPPVYAP